MLDCFMSQNGPLPSSTYANLTFIQSSRKRLSQATFNRFHLTVVGTTSKRPYPRPISGFGSAISLRLKVFIADTSHQEHTAFQLASG